MLNKFKYPGKISDEELRIDPKIVLTWEDKAHALEWEIDTKEDLFQ